MKILKHSDNTSTNLFLASHIANIILQKQYFDYTGNLLDKPKDLPPVIYDEVEYYIYTSNVYIICHDKSKLNINGIIDITRKLVHNPSIAKSEMISIYHSDINTCVSETNKEVVISVRSGNKYPSITLNVCTSDWYLRGISTIQVMDDSMDTLIHINNAILVDFDRQFNTNDFVTDVGNKIPLQMFRHYDKILTESLVLDISCSIDVVCKDFTDESTILRAYSSSDSFPKHHQPNLYKVLLCDIFEESWDNINPISVSDNYSTSVNTIDTCYDEVLSHISSTVTNKSSKKIKYNTPPKTDICTCCKALLCDEIYVLEIETKHWCFCRLCLDFNLYNKIRHVYNTTILKVKYPRDIKSTINMLDIETSIKLFLINVTHKKNHRLYDYTGSRDIYIYLCRNINIDDNVRLFNVKY